MSIQGLLWNKYSVEGLTKYNYSKELLFQKNLFFFKSQINHLIVFITSLKVLTQNASYLLTGTKWVGLGTGFNSIRALDKDS